MVPREVRLASSLHRLVALLLALVGAVAVLLRRARSGQAERDVWNEATTTPDLR